MTFQIFNHRVLAIALFLMASVSVNAQQSASMQQLIGMSLMKIEQQKPETFLNCVAEMKRIDAMYPDSMAPKYQMALQSLYYAVLNPQAEPTEGVLAETEQTIAQMETMADANQSDLCTLKGFLYMVRIVQAQNGQRYYMQVMENYEKALKLNPDNALAKQLQEKFYEGMRQQQ